MHATVVMLLVCTAGMLAPAFAGVWWSGARALPARITAGLASVALLDLAAIGILRALGREPSPAAFGAALGALTLGAGAAAALRRRPLPGRPGAAAGAVAAGAFVLFAFAGLRVVPPLEDQDFEIQATANGLVRDLSPVCLTNRSRLHFFAHPPLLHVLGASTLALAGELDDVRPAYDVAREELRRVPSERGAAAIARAFRDPPRLPDRFLLWAREVEPAFRAAPALTGTRAPNFVLGAAAALLVFGWCRRLGATGAGAALAAAAYATLPEVFVRSGYGGYYALTAVTLTAGAWLAADRPLIGRGAGVAGALAALANHKTLLLGAATVAVRLALRRGPSPALALGMAAGTAAFWAWGLAIDPADFVGEHLLDHGVRRFAGGEVLARGGEPVYPSRLGVWLEFGAHFGWVWVALVASALARALRVGFRRRAADAAPAGDDVHLAVLSVWVLAVAVAFTLTDWRQTKHLCLLAPAAAVLIGTMEARAAGRWRAAIRLGLAVSLAWNAVWIVRLASDFGAMAPTPLW